jgi:hypothetical protein
MVVAAVATVVAAVAMVVAAVAMVVAAPATVVAVLFRPDVVAMVATTAVVAAADADTKGPFVHKQIARLTQSAKRIPCSLGFASRVVPLSSQ